MLPADDDLRLPSLDALRAFEAASRLGSFERAADALAVTASAIGKRIAALESLLGSELLQRGGKALQPTAGGRDYLAQVQPALTLLLAVPQHRRPVQRVRRLRVSSPPTFARQVLVPGTPWCRAAGRDWPEPAGGRMLVDLGLTLEAAVAGQGGALARPSLAGAWLASGTLRPLFALTAEPAQQYCVRHGPGEDAAIFTAWLGRRCTRRAAEALALVSGRA